VKCDRGDGELLGTTIVEESVTSPLLATGTHGSERERESDTYQLIENLEVLHIVRRPLHEDVTIQA
jgi:hypothetical protein